MGTVEIIQNARKCSEVTKLLFVISEVIKPVIVFQMRQNVKLSRMSLPLDKQRDVYFFARTIGRVGRR